VATNISNIQRLVPGLIERTKSQPAAKEMNATQEASFKDLFSNLINSVNEAQQDAGQIQTDFLDGKPVELHEVMIKAEEAGLSMDLLLEIRNRLVNAYSELMRMPM